MAVIEGSVSAELAGVGLEASKPLHVTVKPTPIGALGQYRVSHRVALLANQAANSRLFELQNPTTNVYIIHSVRMEFVQTAAHTAAILDSLDIFKCTGFSVMDTVNTVTPTLSKLRTSFANSGANVRGCTIAGAAAGMTGGTLTKDSTALRSISLWLLAAVPTGGATPMRDEVFTFLTGEYPLVLAQNEGFIIENRVLLGAAAGSLVNVDVQWSEATLF